MPEASDVIAKRKRLFARDREWCELTDFVTSSQERALLGLVYGQSTTSIVVSTPVPPRPLPLSTDDFADRRFC